MKSVKVFGEALWLSLIHICHTIGLHTYTHNYSKVYASVDAYFNDLNKVGKMVKGLIGFVPKYIRFPGGGSNMVSKKYTPGIMSVLVSEVQNRGYQYYDWNASTGDANGNNIAVHKFVKEATSSHACILYTSRCV